jgi:hypothetical protein
MNGKRIWQSRDSWRGISFKEFRDSREWRYLLELNPSFDIRTHPAPGVPIHTRGYIGAGKSAPKQKGTAGILKNPDLVFDTAVGDQPNPPRSLRPSHFPWNSADEYVERLGDYTAQAMLGRDRTNGFSLDSQQALSDTQRG